MIGVSRSIQPSDFAHPDFTALPAELSSGDAARKVVAGAIAQFGRIDALVHVMGGFAGGQSVADTDDATLEKMLDLNFRAAFHILRAVIAADARAGRRPHPGGGEPPGSRAGRDGGGLQRVQGRAGLPGQDRRAGEQGSRHLGQHRAAGQNGHPEQPGTEPDPDTAQVASLLVYLASDAAAQVTGAAIPVYGTQV